MSFELTETLLTPELKPSLGEALVRLQNRLRPGQRRIAEWQGGSLAVSAVPGAGKSTGMAIASAILLGKRYQRAIEQKATPGDQLVLVTFTRSAAANLKLKIRECLRELGLPTTGFVVHTLHGLALNIATRHPALSGLNLDRITLVSPNQSHRLIRTAVEQWIASHPQRYQRLIEGRQFDGEETERLRRQSVLRTEILPALAQTVIHEAKSSGLLPNQLHALNEEARSHDSEDYQVLAIAAGLYEQYQLLLQQRGFIDYDDMILAALRVLENESARQLWQEQVFAVFEDEAQDSSPLQTQLLQILAANPVDETQLNLVRVGDPNQAINSTFTPADPLFFRQFCGQCQTQNQLAEMDQAGRSTLVIINAANFMLQWVNQRYSSFQGGVGERSPFRPQVILPAAFDDPQADANPLPEGYGLELRFPRDIAHSVELIGKRAAELLTQHSTGRAAILVRENRQGRYIADLLRNPKQYAIDIDLAELGIEVYDVGERDRQSHVPAEILSLLQFLDRPHSPDFLKAALKVLVDRQLIPTQDLNILASQPEQFLYPSPIEPPQADLVVQARRYCTGLLRARLELPHFQLIPFLALTLRYEQAELATADKLAERITRQTMGNASLAAAIEALSEIVRSENFEPIETDDSEARYTRSGQLTIITMHKSKGLDWDFVFIPFLHEQMIPGRPWIPPQTTFLGDFSLPEVARAQIRAHIHGEALPSLDAAWERAGYLKMAEEFRLLYVAMTRAKRLLWMSAERKAPFTWSKPDSLEDKTPCPVLTALSDRFPQAVRMPTHQ